MSNFANDMMVDKISDDVYDLYADKGVWGVIDKISTDYGKDKVVYSKDDDTHCDVLIGLMYGDWVDMPGPCG